MSYGKVKETFWTSKKVRSFSDDAKLLALYFLSCPHRNMLGCARIPNGYILDDLGWTSRRLADAMSILSASHFLVRDNDGWTLILGQQEHDPVRNPNHVKTICGFADNVPADSPVYPHLVTMLTSHLDAIGMASSWRPHDKPTPIRTEPIRSEAVSVTEPNRETSPPLEVLDEIAEAVAAWNAMATKHHLPTVQKTLNAARRKALRLRLDECGGLPGWQAMLERIPKAPFLLGDNDRKWRADFDFVLKPMKFAKIVDGSYERVNGATSAESAPVGSDAWRKANGLGPLGGGVWPTS